MENCSRLYYDNKRTFIMMILLFVAACLVPSNSKCP